MVISSYCRLKLKFWFVEELHERMFELKQENQHTVDTLEQKLNHMKTASQKKEVLLFVTTQYNQK